MSGLALRSIAGKVRMDLQRIRNALTPAQQAAFDLDAAWLHYRSTGGLDDTDSFDFRLPSN